MIAAQPASACTSQTLRGLHLDARRIAVIAIALMVPHGIARAAKPAPEVRPVAPSSVRVIGTSRAGPACTMGAAGPSLYSVNYLLPPNDAYYTRLTCEACAASDTIVMQEVHVALAFSVSCTQEITIGLVGAAGDTACRMPDTLALLRSPESFLLSPQGPGNYEFTLSLHDPVAISGDAFLCITFVSLATECESLAMRPQLLTSGTCSRCRTWNISTFGEQDLCAVAFPGQPVMWALGTACVVPVRSRTWGAVKVLYR